MNDEGVRLINGNQPDLAAGMQNFRMNEFRTRMQKIWPRWLVCFMVFSACKIGLGFYIIYHYDKERCDRDLPHWIRFMASNELFALVILISQIRANRGLTEYTRERFNPSLFRPPGENNVNADNGNPANNVHAANNADPNLLQYGINNANHDVGLANNNIPFPVAHSVNDLNNFNRNALNRNLHVNYDNANNHHPLPFNHNPDLNQVPLGQPRGLYTLRGPGFRFQMQMASNANRPGHQDEVNANGVPRRVMNTMQGLKSLTVIIHTIMVLYGIFMYLDSKAGCAENAPHLYAVFKFYMLVGLLTICTPCFICVGFCCYFGFLVFRVIRSHPRQVPAPRDVMENLISRKAKDAELSGDQECVICMVEYKPEDSVVQLNCNQKHHFHEACLRQWLTINGVCPICRHRIE